MTTRVSFSMSVTSASRLPSTNVFTVPTARATELSARSSSTRSLTSADDMPDRSRMKARTRRSFWPSASVNCASSVTDAKRSSLPLPKVSLAAERFRSISLPSSPCPLRAFADASSRWLRVPSLLTPFGPSASDRSRRLA